MSPDQALDAKLALAEWLAQLRWPERELQLRFVLELVSGTHQGRSERRQGEARARSAGSESDRMKRLSDTRHITPELFPEAFARADEKLEGFNRAQAAALTLEINHGRRHVGSVAGPLFDDQMKLEESFDVPF